MNPTYVFEDIPTELWQNDARRIPLLGARAEQQLFFLSQTQMGNQTRVFYLEGFSLGINGVLAQAQATPMA